MAKGSGGTGRGKSGAGGKSTVSRGAELRAKYGDSSIRSDRGRRNLEEKGRPEENATTWLNSVTRYNDKVRKKMGKKGRQEFMDNYFNPKKPKVNIGSKPVKDSTPGSQTNRAKKARTNPNRLGNKAAREVVGKAKRSKSGVIRFDRKGQTTYKGY
jgi:hypothetical protein